MLKVHLDKSLLSLPPKRASMPFTAKRCYEHFGEEDNNNASRRFVNTKEMMDEEFIFHCSTQESLIYGKSTETKNHFLNAILCAYNSHIGLRLSPDDLIIQLNLFFSQYVNENAEAVRKVFVDHEGKEKIVLTYNSAELHWDVFMEDFEKELNKRVKCDESGSSFASLLTPNFSTTTKTVKTASSILKMATFKKYFEYGMMLGCGIPFVELSGTKEDWKSFKTKWVTFKNFLPKMNVSENVTNWANTYDEIVSLFVGMRELKDEGETDAPSDVSELWKRIVTYIPYGSGSQQYLSGWSQFLFPSTTRKYRAISLKDGWKDVHAEDAPVSVANVNCELNQFGVVSDLRLFSGFIGYNVKENVVAPVIGYYVFGKQCLNPRITVDAAATVGVNEQKLNSEEWKKYAAKIEWIATEKLRREEEQKRLAAEAIRQEQERKRLAAEKQAREDAEYRIKYAC